VIDSGDSAAYLRVLGVWAAVLTALHLFQQAFG
jgi:hypothetical protein